MNWRTILLRQIILLSFAAATVFAQNSLSAIGGFEGPLPSFWKMGSQPTGATLSWATDQSRSFGHSLKIDKPGVTTDSATWISEQIVYIPWYKVLPSGDLSGRCLLVGAYVKLMNVNVNPADDDQRWWISYTFYDSSGAPFVETKLPMDQSTASSSGWLDDINAVCETILDRDAWKLIVKFVAGKNATGTVWADDFMLYEQTFDDLGLFWSLNWNTGLLVPTGWYYWFPLNGGDDGLVVDGFVNTFVTNEAAHSGLNSLKFTLPVDREPHDGYVGTIPRPFSDIGSNIGPGDSINISVWIKASDLVPDGATANPGTWSVGITPLFFRNDTVELSRDYYFTFPPSQTSFDWTKYTQGVRISSNVGATDMEIRLHVYSRMVGTIFFDDLSVTKVSGALIALDASTTDLGRISNTMPHRDTAFTVRNIGFATDSITILLDPVNVIPETAVGVTPTSFYLAPGDSQKVTFSIQPQLLVPQYYQTMITVQPKSGLGQGSLSKSFAFQIVIASAVSTSTEIPKEFALDQNYPNPFNPSTTFRYGLPHKTTVQLTVFNTLGQSVSTLVNGEQDAGYHEVKFEGSGLSSGVYFYRLQAGDFTQTKRLLLLK